MYWRQKAKWIVWAPVFLLGCAVALAQNDGELEEVIVTGSYIKRPQQADTISPIDVIGSEYLSDIAAFTPADFVASLPFNNGAQNQNDGFNQTNSLGTNNVNLRGLGVSSTLTLLNGRRQTVSAATTLNGDQFVDLNSLIPAIAIERIEILQDGASSLYGSDAVAGVVNVISRKSFEGFEVDVNYISAADSQEDASFSAIFGGNFGDLHAMGAISYFDRSGLSAEDRRSEFELRDAFTIFGQPGTYLVAQTAGAPVRTVDPQCAAVAARSNDVNHITAGPVASLNPTCQFDFGDYFRLVAEEQRLQAYSDVSLMLNDSTEAFFEFGYADNEIESTGSPSQPILFAPALPAGNPGATTLGNNAVAIFTRVDGADAAASPIQFDYQTIRLSAGSRGEFDNGWIWEASITYSENNFDYINRSDTLVDRYLEALKGTGGPNNDAYFNPLFGASNDAAVREDFRGFYIWDAESSLMTLDAFVSGEWIELDAGPVGLAVGMQYREDELSYDYNQAAEDDNLYFFIGNRSFDDDQNVSAIFAEVDVPLAVDLNIQASLRYEDFGDDDTVDPKIGLLWKATEQISLRGSYGTSFRIPSLFQKAGRFNGPARVSDPNVSDNPATNMVTVAQRTSGDPEKDIESQESDVFNIGVSWESNDTSWSMSIDYWSFEYENFITPENAAAVVASAPDGPQVERASDGTLLTVETFFRNASTLETDGIDFSIAKELALPMGSMRLSLDCTHVLSYDLDDPILGSVDGLGQRNFTNFGVPMPELRANFGVSWTGGVHGARLYVRYIDSYSDENNNDESVDSIVTADLQYRYAAPSLLDLDEGAVLSVGVRNLFDEMPPDVQSRTGYDPLTHSPLGRQVYFSIRQAF